jgi:L-gulono-1,4-lactone dehydrogenase
MRTYGAMSRWRNWARTVEATPSAVVTPRDPADVAAVLARAAEAGITVKPVGSGHSFTAIAATDGIQVRLDALTGLLGIDVDQATGRGTATFGAGTPLHAVNAALAARGLGLANMGDIAAQTVSGAISTGTHGTGRDIAGLAAQVAGLQLALPDGTIADVSPDHDPDLFAAARLGLGALGVITAVTLRVEPGFLLHAVEEPSTFEEVVEGFDDLAAEQHAEFYWLPFTDAVQLKRNRRHEGPERPLGRLRSWWAQDVVENAGLAVVQRLTRTAPKLTPPVNRAAARLVTRRDYIDAAPAVYTTVRRVRFHEMEYALPREAAVPALRRFRELTVNGPWRIAFPVEVRLAPADDVWLSTAYGRDTVYVATHAYPRTEYRGWFDAVEALWAEFGGRPHWGKLHTRDVAYLTAAYPRMTDFLAVRDRVDPTRTMANAYLDHVIGR